VNWQVGDRAYFNAPAYADLVGPVNITAKVGCPSDSYQWEVRSDDGRDWLALDYELEVLND
jgi:hypothetical protein